MRIAHVLSTLNLGGQERVALDLARGQKNAGHDLLVIGLDTADGPLRSEFDAAKIAVRAVEKRPGGVDLGLSRRLLSTFAEYDIELVHTHNPQPLFYAALPARLSGRGLVHTKHGVNPSRARRRWIRRGLGHLVQGFVAVSEPTAEIARAGRECWPGALEVITNGTELARFGADLAHREAIRDELGIPRDAFVVGTIGRVYPEKAHPFLIESIADDLGDLFHLVIVGPGPDLERVAEKVALLRRPDAVHLTGMRRDVPELLTAFDVFALSSRNEGLPLVLPEAMATELPVVATSVGGVPDVVAEGETGFLVPFGDRSALRDRVRRLREGPALRARMGTRAREVALERYSAERMVTDYLNLYRRVLSS